jgi:hypothetical protein
MGAAISLKDLVERGEHDDHLHAPTGGGPTGPLEWLGLAVGELPYLTSGARTVDDINWRSLAPNASRTHLGFIDALTQHLASSAALLYQALIAHIERHPETGDAAQVIDDVDFLSLALVEEHPPLSRRAELLMGSYATALAAAVQASGRFCEAKLAEANGQTSKPDASTCAAVVADALTRGLATLLGHARLNRRDWDYVAARSAA